MSHGLRAAFDEEYNRICENLVRLGDMVDQAIAESMRSLQQRDAVLAEQVIEADQEINELRFQVEEACLVLIATQQPAATDLRAVVAAMNIVVEIERMGDHATGIAKTVILMGDQALVKPLIDLPRMAEICREMLRSSLDAYLKRDAALARSVAGRDDELDLHYKVIFGELAEIMAQDRSSVAGATFLLWSAHNLERIGDRVTNIAERVVFMTTGDMQELNL